MKKVIVIAVTILGAIALLVGICSCDWLFPPDGTGFLKVTIDYEPGDSVIVDKYTLELSGPQGQHVSKELTGNMDIIGDLKVGFWKVEASALDVNGSEVAEGLNGTTVSTDKMVELSIKLESNGNTIAPTAEPTIEPTETPTADPTAAPTDEPTDAPTIVPTFTITASAGTGGSISPSGVQTVNSGEPKTFNISATSCYSINDVIVDGSSVGARTSYTFDNITADHTIQATFSIKTYTITASAGAHGSISQSGTRTFNCGDSQTYSITPDECYEISQVIVDGVDKGNISSYKFNNLNANHSIDVYFNKIVNTVILSAGSGGSVANVGPGTYSIQCGDSLSFTITANAGYAVASVTGNGEPSVDAVGAGQVQMTYKIYGSGTIQVNFRIAKVTYTYCAGSTYLDFKSGTFHYYSGMYFDTSSGYSTPTGYWVPYSGWDVGAKGLGATASSSVDSSTRRITISSMRGDMNVYAKYGS